MRSFNRAWDSGDEPDPAPGLSLLDLKRRLARNILSSCRLCERRCGVDRLGGDTGYCGVGEVSRLASEFLHLGEEPELVPSHTLFFSGCTFRCIYCQNWDLAMSPVSGVPTSAAEMAQMLERGHRQGSLNANFVGGNPDPHLHTILDTIGRLGPECSRLAMVWNSNMYCSEETMELTAGVMDIYLADFRYGTDACAERYSDVTHYFPVVSRNFLMADHQAEVMLRQLVLPGHLECCTGPIMQWVARNLPGVYFNLMFQYRPEYKAGSYPELDRRLTPAERQAALDMADSYGIGLS